MLNLPRIAIAASLCLSATAQAELPVPDNAKVLFIGNSLFGSKEGGVPEYSNQAMQAMGHAGIQTHLLANWGKSLDYGMTRPPVYHDLKVQPRNNVQAILNGPDEKPGGEEWDYVVLQGYGDDSDDNNVLDPSQPDGVSGHFFDAVVALNDAAKSVGATTVLYMRWPNNPVETSVSWYNQQLVLLENNYDTIAEHLGLEVIPVALICDDLIYQNPPDTSVLPAGLDRFNYLYVGDNIHQSDLAKGMFGYAVATILTRTSPIGNDFEHGMYVDVPSSIDRAQQEAVWRVIGEREDWTGNGGTQRLLLTGNTVTVAEGGSATLTLHLAKDPGGSFTVNLSRTSGDNSLGINPGSITFNSSNWSSGRTITINADEDADQANGEATFTISAPVAGSETITATEADNDIQEPVVFDDDAPEFSYTSGWWPIELNAIGGSAHTSQNDANKTATLTPGLTGIYYVEFYAPSGSSRTSPGVRATLTHTGGSTELLIDQTTAPNTWQRPSATAYTLNTNSTIVIYGDVAADADSSSERPIVDAIRFFPVGGNDSQPTITTNTLADARTGLSYSQTVMASSGDAPFTWSVTSGSLPAGISLSASTGVISGTPSQTTSSTASFTIQIKDTDGDTDTQPLSLKVTAEDTQPTITTTTLPGVLPGEPYSEVLGVSSGDAPFAWNITSGSLPAGLNLSGNDGEISGWPAAAGVSTFTVQVTDSDGDTDRRELTLTVAPIGDPEPSGLSATVEIDPWSNFDGFSFRATNDSESATITQITFTINGGVFDAFGSNSDFTVTESALSSSSDGNASSITATLVFNSAGLPANSSTSVEAEDNYQLGDIDQKWSSIDFAITFGNGTTLTDTLSNIGDNDDGDPRLFRGSVRASGTSTLPSSSSIYFEAEGIPSD